MVRRVLLSLVGPLKALLLQGLVLLVALVGSFYAVPLPERLDTPGSTVVTWRDGSPAHVFLAPDDRWRVPVALDRLDSDYVRALLAYEDKRFYAHPGVDGLAVLRAAALNLRHGRVMSGGSTLTMQLVRVLEPRPRTLGSKVVEAYRALQLEWFLSKDEVLAAYVSFAPMGRNVEGVEAASLAYFGHSADELSLAEIATLLAVPQNPSVRYPRARNRARLTQARDQVAAFLLQRQALPLGPLGVTAAQALSDVRATPVPVAMRSFPREVPHMSRWLQVRHPELRRIQTTLDRGTQLVVDRRVASARARLEPLGIHNGAVVVVEHSTGRVRALAGNLGFDQLHGRQIPMFDVARSPGSALKPLIYAMAIDRGLALPEHLVPDVPARFEGYAPRNYDGEFDGLVRLDDALSRSLNLPFVYLLRDVGTERFLGQLRRMGASHLVDTPGHYGLSAAIGSVELSPLELAGIYASLAQGGRYRPLRLLADAPEHDTDQALSSGAVWLTRQALSKRDRPDFPARRALAALPPAIHWKTGTSFGHRDAWAVGSGPRYTTAVWLGNADNSSSRHLVGAQAAGPILFDVLEALGSDHRPSEPRPPNDLSRVEVCSYSGHLPGPACAHTKHIWARTEAVPIQACPYHVRLEVDTRSGEAVRPGCREGRDTVVQTFVRWPSHVRRFLGSQHLRLPEPPRWASACSTEGVAEPPRVVHPVPGQVNLLLPGVPEHRQEIPLEADSSSRRVSWFVDGRFLGKSAPHERMWWTPVAGQHEVVVVDEAGQSSRVDFEVRRRL